MKSCSLRIQKDRTTVFRDRRNFLSDSRGKVPINVYIGNNCSSDATPSIIFARQPFFISIDVDIKKYESIVVGPNSPEMDTYLEIFSKGPSISKPGLVQLDDRSCVRSWIISGTVYCGIWRFSDTGSSLIASGPRCETPSQESTLGTAT